MSRRNRMTRSGRPATTVLDDKALDELEALGEELEAEDSEELEETDAVEDTPEADASDEVEETDEEDEDEPDYMTPSDLADELDISPKVLRAWLRKEYPRSSKEKNTSWHLTDEQVEAARDRWAEEEDEDDEDQTDEVESDTDEDTDDETDEVEETVEA